MYRIELKDQAERFLGKLDKETATRVADKIAELKDNPFPRGFIKLKDTVPPSHRLRVGKYRLLYQVYQEELLVVIVKIEKREGFYDNI